MSTATTPPETDTRTKVNNICAVAFILRAMSPDQIFGEIKWDYPAPAFDRMFCPIGGNWWGDNAVTDWGPKGTLRRELGEELCFNSPSLNDELAGLGVGGESFSGGYEGDREPNTDEKRQLADVSKFLQTSIAPFGDFISSTNTSVHRAAGDTEREGTSAIISAWTVMIPEDVWQLIAKLQGTFGNLSNESRTVMTSLQKMCENGTRTAFGHDRILQAIFRSFGLKDAERLPLIYGVTTELIGHPRAVYNDYLINFDVNRKPPGF